MENNTYANELQHWGIKGQKWGRRRYQNPDGSLTAEGKKRYNAEVAKLKEEEAKIKAAEKVAATKKKTQAKIDKLDAKKAELEERKKALKKGGKDEPEEKPEETVAQKRERLLKSNDPKELYKDRDVLTYQELNDRVNRIDLEARLHSKIPAEPAQPSALDRMDKATNAIRKSTALYKSVDDGVSTLANSYIGKTLAKQLGLDLPKEEKTFNLDDFVKNINKKSNQEVQDVANRVRNQETIEKAINKLSKGNKTNNDAVDYKDVLKNIDQYSDEDLQKIAQRAENQAKIKNNSEKFDQKKKDDE